MREVELTIESAARPNLFGHGQWHLLRSMTVQQLSVRYRQSSLALLWMAVSPIAMVAVYAIFFSGVLDVDGDGLPYLSFIVAGLVSWRFFSTAVAQSSVLGDQSYVMSKVYFPREMVPLSVVLSGLVELGVGTVIMFVVTWFQGYPPSYFLVMLPVIYLLLILVTATATLMLSTLAVFIRDLNHGMPMLLQLMFFSSPIMYPPSQLPSWLAWVTAVNPLSVVVMSIRDVVFENRWPNMALLLTHLVIAGAALVLAVAYVRSVEHRLVDVA